jgi:hypothetical protein
MLPKHVARSLRHRLTVGSQQELSDTFSTSPSRQLTREERSFSLPAAVQESGELLKMGGPMGENDSVASLYRQLSPRPQLVYQQWHPAVTILFAGVLLGSSD